MDIWRDEPENPYDPANSEPGAAIIAAQDAERAAIARSEQWAEGAWLRYAERSTPESEQDLREFDAERDRAYAAGTGWYDSP